MKAADAAVAFANALPTMPFVDAVRLALNLARRGLELVPAGRQAGWCPDCLTLYGYERATLCRMCGAVLLPVAYTIESLVT